MKKILSFTFAFNVVCFMAHSQNKTNDTLTNSTTPPTIVKKFHQGRWERVSEMTQEELFNPKKHKLESSKEDLRSKSDNQILPRTASINWKDTDGNIYIFGGKGIDETKNEGLFSDIWQYTPKSKKWVSVNGQKESKKFKQNDEKSLTTTTTSPLARQDAATWVGKDNCLYLFGGNTSTQSENLGDFWKFDNKTKTWTLISNSTEFNKKSVSSGKNKSNKINTPAGRANATTWVDKNGDFWLFGGLTYDKTLATNGYLNDLWKYDFNKKTWIWINGELKTNSKANKNQDSKTESFPSSRAQCLAWYDKSNNNLWLYGGFGLSDEGNFYGGLSDMWFFDIKSSKWILKYSSSKLFQQATVKTIGYEHTENNPGFRIGGTTWVDGSGDLLLYGGQKTFNNDTLKMERNIWKFSLSTLQWIPIYAKKAPSIISSAAHNEVETNEVWFICGEYMDDKFNVKYSNTIWKFKEQ
ncbi:kelch repeat-containing protein [Lacihabitans sp. CS3-21]|uniref:kelch repeat-containing protein n=1 Tax=Lacihabitans sp. CS3-21 TaxID=2487332 RepID=UPI0020CEDF87|nr:kelch repeat-containing protein [Lacihabitans sp. CS3-21]MCP9745768.1 hypothetical protein [Lacihabitans sp. CS3-21]